MDLESEKRELTEAEDHIESRLNPVDPDMLHVGQEMAVAEGDVDPGPQHEFVRGTSLWQDAWRMARLSLWREKSTNAYCELNKNYGSLLIKCQIW